MTGQELLEFLEELTDDERKLEVKVGYNYGDYHNTHATGPVRGAGVVIEVDEAYSNDRTGIMDDDEPDEDGIAEELDEDANRVIVITCHRDGDRL